VRHAGAGLGAGLRRWLPKHLFIYIMGRGFFTTWIAAAGAGALASRWSTHRSHRSGDLMLARFLTASGEAFLTGMLTRSFVAFPAGVAGDLLGRLYLPRD